MLGSFEWKGCMIYNAVFLSIQTPFFRDFFSINIDYLSKFFFILSLFLLMIFFPAVFSSIFFKLQCLEERLDQKGLHMYDNKCAAWVLPSLNWRQFSAAPLDVPNKSWSPNKSEVGTFLSFV